MFQHTALYYNNIQHFTVTTYCARMCYWVGFMLGLIPPSLLEFFIICCIYRNRFGSIVCEVMDGVDTLVPNTSYWKKSAFRCL